MHKTTKVIPVALVAIAIAFFLQTSPFQKFLDNSVVALEEHIRTHPIAGVLTFAGLAALSAVFSAFTSVPLVPVAVAVWGKTAVVALLLWGWLLGGAFTYLIGKYAAYPLLKHFVHHERIERYRAKLPHTLGFFLVFLARLAFPAEIPGYLLGILRYHFGKYILATFLAELPFAIITVYAGDALLLREPALFFGALMIAVILVLVALGALRYESKVIHKHHG